jgi:hypothetical protein
LLPYPSNVVGPRLWFSELPYAVRLDLPVYKLLELRRLLPVGKVLDTPDSAGASTVVAGHYDNSLVVGLDGQGSKKGSGHCRAPSKHWVDPTLVGGSQLERHHFPIGAFRVFAWVNLPANDTVDRVEREFDPLGVQQDHLTLGHVGDLAGRQCAQVGERQGGAVGVLSESSGRKGMRARACIAT